MSAPQNPIHYRSHDDGKHCVLLASPPTAWVSGFDRSATLRFSACMACVPDTPGATAGFLEFTGKGHPGYGDVRMPSIRR